MTPIVERPAMSDYGVPEDLDGVLPWEWAEERLVGSRNYWVSTVGPEGRPHSMPVWGVWVPTSERFWFGCSPKSRKARNLRSNPAVVIAPTDSVEVVSLEGRAKDRKGADIKEFIDAYVGKYAEEMGMERSQVAEFLSGNAAFAVAPDRAFGVIERPDDFSKRATRWRWPEE